MKLSELTKKINESLDSPNKVVSGKDLPKNTILQPTTYITALMKGEKVDVPLIVDLYKNTLTPGDDSEKCKNTLKSMLKDTASFAELEKAIKAIKATESLSTNEGSTDSMYYNYIQQAALNLELPLFYKVCKSVVPDLRDIPEKYFESVMTFFKSVDYIKYMKIANNLKLASEVDLQDDASTYSSDTFESTQSDLEKQLIDLKDKGDKIKKQLDDMKEKSEDTNDDMENIKSKDFQKTVDEDGCCGNKKSESAKEKAKQTINRLYEEAMKEKAIREGSPIDVDIPSNPIDDDDMFDVPRISSGLENDTTAPVIFDDSSDMQDDMSSDPSVKDRSTLPNNSVLEIEEDYNSQEFYEKDKYNTDESFTTDRVIFGNPIFNTGNKLKK